MQIAQQVGLGFTVQDSRVTDPTRPDAEWLVENLSRFF